MAKKQANPQSFKKNFAFIKPYLMQEKGLLFLGFILMMFVSLVHLVDPLILAHIVDYSVPNKDVPDMYRYSLFFLAVIVLSGIVSYGQIIMLSKLGLKVITQIKSRLFKHLMKIPVSFFDNRPVGDFITKIESDSEKVRFLFTELSIRIIGNFIFAIGVIGVIAYKAPSLSIWMMLGITVMLIGYNFFIRFINKLFKIEREKYSEVTAKVTEYIQGMNVIQTFNKQKVIVDDVEKSSQEKRDTQARAMYWEHSIEGFFIFIAEDVLFIVIILLMAPQIFSGVKSVGELIIFSQYLNRIIWPLMELLENFMQIQRSMVSLTRIRELSELPAEDAYEKVETINHFEHEIEFKNVWFAYDEDISEKGKTAKPKWILKDVSFKVKKGDKIALVGSSGSGKTTTISLLCGFYHHQKGQILIDGKPIKDLNIQRWREHLGLILQDIILFPGNVLENVRIYNDNISEEKVLESIKMVHAEKFTQSNALTNVVAERGQNFSQGEKQLLSFARALTFSPEIVIMDEATSSIDTITEKLIQHSMEKVLHGKTSIIVAHRLSSIIDADNIILFQDGEILAQGRHDDMFANCEEYKNLVKLQFLNSHKKVLKGGCDE